MNKNTDILCENKAKNVQKNFENKGVLSALENNDILPFHMPGHKRKGYDFLMGVDKLDVTEIDGFDNLHDADGMLFDAQNRASELFKVKRTFFLVNGSTGGILAGIRTLLKEGESVLIARNCHKSVFNAVEIARLKSEYLYPKTFDSGFLGAVEPDMVEAAFKKNPNIKCVVITSPTYEGVVSDVESIATICHAHGATLFVDEAHGAHLSLCDGFEKSARDFGADLVVNSVHKTLASLTQTALLHACSDRVDIDVLNKNLAVFQSSSPSYLLMASIDGCVESISQKGEQLATWSDLLDYAREKLARLEVLKIFAPCKSEKAYAYDKSKIVILCDEANISGVELKQILRAKYNIELEMAGVNYAIAMSGMGDNKASFDRFVCALLEIDATLEKMQCKKSRILPQNAKKAFETYQINTLSAKYVDFEHCIGRVSAENIWAYPPGCPIIVKGEEITQEAYDTINRMLEVGVSVSSEMRKMPKVLCVLADDR